MIVYFTGTGNSRFTAKMLADLLGDEAVSANDYIKSKDHPRLVSEKPWVFVCPVYLSAIPVIFEDFIRGASFEDSKKAWFVVTSAGTSVCACPVYAEALSKEKGFEYMGTANVTMPQNYLISFFKTKSKEECAGIIEAAKPRIAELGGYIAGGKPFEVPDVKKWEIISTKMVLGPFSKLYVKADAFYATDKCIGCGTCARVCPLNNISLVDGKPVWGKSCTHCVACINLCPTQAIEYGKATLGKPRCRCPEYKK